MPYKSRFGTIHYNITKFIKKNKEGEREENNAKTLVRSFEKLEVLKCFLTHKKTCRKWAGFIGLWGMV